MSIPLDVKTLRAKVRWTQDELAQFLDVDRSTVSRMETRGTVRGSARKLLKTLEEAAEAGTADALKPAALAQTEAAE